MAILPILIHPDPRLKVKCTPVTDFDDALKTLSEDMLETMYDAPGIGLAAPQVGVTRRMLVMDCAGKEDEPQPMVLVNPEVIAASEEMNTYNEGCLSIPEQFDDVERPAEVTVRFQDVEGNSFTQDFAGIWATCVQHEIDHLDGKLFIDYLSRMKRGMITRKMEKLKRDRALEAS
ncbi:MAG: peptide deformylase [Pseudomonadota bacterium]